MESGLSLRSRTAAVCGQLYAGKQVLQAIRIHMKDIALASSRIIYKHFITTDIFFLKSHTLVL
jgi:hypothetical protein